MDNKKVSPFSPLESEVNSPFIKEINTLKQSNSAETRVMNENEGISPNIPLFSEKLQLEKSEEENVIDSGKKKKKYDLISTLINYDDGKNIYQYIQDEIPQTMENLFSLDNNDLNNIQKQDIKFQQKIVEDQRRLQTKSLEWNLKDFTTTKMMTSNESENLEIVDPQIYKIYLTKDESTLIALSTNGLNIFDFKTKILVYKLQLFQLGENRKFDFDIVFPDDDSYGFLLFADVILKIKTEKKENFEFEILCIGNSEVEIKKCLENAKIVMDIDLPKNIDFKTENQYLLIEDEINSIKISPNGNILAYKNKNDINFLRLQEDNIIKSKENIIIQYKKKKSDNFIDFEFLSNEEYICLFGKNDNKNMPENNKLQRWKIGENSENFINEKPLESYFEKIKISQDRKYIAIASLTKKEVLILKSQNFDKLNNNCIPINQDNYVMRKIDDTEDLYQKICFLGKLQKSKNIDNQDAFNRDKISFTQDHLIVCNDLNLELWSLEENNVIKFSNSNNYRINHEKRMIEVDYPLFALGGSETIVAYYRKSSLIKMWKINKEKPKLKELIKIEITKENLIDNYKKLENRKQDEDDNKVPEKLNYIVHSFCMHPNNKILFVGDFYNNIIIINIDDLSLKNYKLSGHKDYVNSIVIISTPNMILSSSLDNTIRIWDYTKSKEISKIDLKNHNVIKSEFSIENNILITFSADYIKFWRYNIGENKIDENSFASIGMLLDEQCYMYKGYSNEYNKTFVKADIFCITNNELFICRRNLVCSYNIEDGERNSKCDLKGHQALIFILKNVNNKQLASGSRDDMIIIWDIKKRIEIKKLKIPNFSSFLLSFDLKLLITTTLDKNNLYSNIEYWDIKSNTNNINHIKSIKSNLNYIVEILMTTDKSKLILGSIDKNIYILKNEIIKKKNFNISDGKLLAISKYQNIYDQNIYVSIFHKNNFLYVIENENGTKIFEIKLKKNQFIFDLKISIDNIGEKIAISYINYIEIWSLYHKIKLIKIKNEEYIRKIFLSSKNRFLVAVSLGGTSMLYELNCKNPKIIINEYLKSPKDLIISIDETRIIALQDLIISIFSNSFEFLFKLNLDQVDSDIALSTFMMKEKANLIILKDGSAKITNLNEQYEWKEYQFNNLFEDILNFGVIFHKNEVVLIIASTSEINLLKLDDEKVLKKIDDRSCVNHNFFITNSDNEIIIVSYAKYGYQISKINTELEKDGDIIQNPIHIIEQKTEIDKNDQIINNNIQQIEYETEQIKELKFTSNKNIIIIQNSSNEITVWDIENAKKKNKPIISNCWTYIKKFILYVENNDKNTLKLYEFEINVIYKVFVNDKEITSICTNLFQNFESFKNNNPNITIKSEQNHVLLVSASQNGFQIVNNIEFNFFVHLLNVHHLPLEMAKPENYLRMDNSNSAIIKILSSRNEEKTEIFYSTEKNFFNIMTIEIKEKKNQKCKSWEHSCLIINIIKTKCDKKIILIDEKNTIIIFESNFMTIANTIKSNYFNINRLSAILSDRLILIHEYIIDIINNEEIAIIPYSKKDEFSSIQTINFEDKLTYYKINKNGIHQADFWMDLFDIHSYNSIMSQLFKNQSIYKTKNMINKFRIPFLFSNVMHIESNKFDNEEEIPQMPLMLFNQRNIFGRTCLDSAIERGNSSLIRKLIHIFDHNASKTTNELLNYNSIYQYLEFYSPQTSLNFFDYLINIMKLFGTDSSPICSLLNHSFLKIETPKELLAEALDSPLFFHHDNLSTLTENLIIEIKKRGKKKFISKLTRIEKLVYQFTTFIPFYFGKLYFDQKEKEYLIDKAKCSIKLKICCIKNILNKNNENLIIFLRKINDVYSFPNEIYNNELLEIIIKYIWDNYYKYLHIRLWFATTIHLFLFIINFNYLIPYRVMNSPLQIDTWPIIISIIIDIYLIFYFFTLFLSEFNQMREKKWRYIYLKTKELDFWNIMDICLIIFGVLSMLLDLSDIFGTETIQSNYKFFPSLTLLFFSFKFISFLRGFKDTGYLIRLIINVMKDITFFVLFIFFFNLSLTWSSHLLYKNPNYNQFETFDFFYKLMLGDFNGYDKFEIQVENHILLWIFFVISTIFVTIILFNLLIAIISDSYEKFMHLKNQSQNYGLLSLILDYRINGKINKKEEYNNQRDEFFFMCYNETFQTQRESTDRLRDVVEIINKKIGDYENDNINENLKINNKLTNDNINYLHEKINELNTKIENNNINLNNDNLNEKIKELNDKIEKILDLIKK